MIITFEIILFRVDVWTNKSFQIEMRFFHSTRKNDTEWVKNLKCFLILIFGGLFFHFGDEGA